MMTRRTALAAGLAGAGALSLAACGNAPPSAASLKRLPANQTIATLADIKIGEAVSATLAGADVVVARPTATTAVCFSAVCTHQGCTVRPAGSQLDCPCHGSVFDATTGKVLQGPAPSPLPPIAVTVRNGSVVSAGTV
ncbi:MAG: Rieske (2Fe-2S) protein [Jatrophihabitantaceae bacterium]